MSFDKGFALTVGINKYSAQPRLTRAVADAQSLCFHLKEAGFAATLCEDPTYLDFDKALFDLKQKLWGAARAQLSSIVVFYFSGHGAVFEDDQYLLPCDYDGSKDDKLSDVCIGLDKVIEYLQQENTSALIFLDCCRIYSRNRPTTEKGVVDATSKGVSSSKTGVPFRYLTCFACRRGAVAYDNGRYSRYLFQSLFSVQHSSVLAAIGEAHGNLVEEETVPRQEPFMEIPGNHGHFARFTIKVLVDQRNVSRPGITKEETPSALGQEIVAAASSLERVQGDTLESSPEEAAKQGDAAAQYNLGLRYMNGEGVFPDVKRAVELYEKAAEQGFARAQCNLGLCYENGTGVVKDEKRAVELYEKAAEQGRATAQYNLGVCYENGTGVPKDVKRAVELYEKAAEQGFAMAQCNLGVCYEYGTGVVEDEKRAVELYDKGAEQGNARAQYNLGVRYENGTGVAKDAKRAVELYEKAAKQGLASAQCRLGLCYQNGTGVAKDGKRAVELYEKAAEQGLAVAQYNLGVCCENGTGVGRDKKRAKQLYQKAAKQGHLESVQKTERRGIATFFSDLLGIA